MAQIINITSEALQATIRRLLPSQQGFGEDLQATNVVTPIIDLTPTAEGSVLPSNLQTALAFDSQTAFNVSNATTTLINTTGFFRVFGVATVPVNSSIDISASFTMSDGLSTKTVWETDSKQYATQYSALQFDFTVFLNAGESLSAVSSNVACVLAGSTRQVATVTGELVNPAGYVSQ
jgi:hypothetical protein